MINKAFLALLFWTSLYSNSLAKDWIKGYTGLSAGTPLLISSRGGVFIPGLYDCSWFGQNCKGYNISGEVGLGGARTAIGWHRMVGNGGFGYGGEAAWMTTWNFVDINKPSQNFGIEAVGALLWFHARMGIYLQTQGPLRGYLQSRTALGIGF